MQIKTSQKLRIRVQSFNADLLILSCRKIINLIEFNNQNLVNFIALPTHKRIYCVLRSPHVDKDSREHFEIRTHKRILDIYYDSETNVFDLLTKLDLPSGVFYRISLTS
uniref:Small ribosomal subunit protein uS10c n=1 Tax=Biddulphia biddulphiana TaxID=1158022 RepID=A0A2U9NSQ4_9STRA|nr:ribosomal protein S10 [Biddulphia biddulphiana]AWT40118.1 ribosomal protein S10 [Biddulphia biddulphiana]